MKKEILKKVFLLLICLVGALLIGFNAGKLSNVINIVLFALGVFLLAGSTTIISLLETLFKKKDGKKEE